MALTPNNLSISSFRVKIARSPDIELRAQAVVVPGVQLGVANQPTPFVPAPKPGNMTYDELVMTIQVGENLAGYLEIFNWMTSLGHPDELAQYPSERDASSEIYSDISVMILSNQDTPILRAHFTDCFPVMLSPLNFDSMQDQVQYLKADIGFKYLRYYLSDPNKDNC